MPSANQTQVEVQRLKDQMAQMRASTVEQIAQLKVEAVSREVEAQRKYDELQLQLKEEAAVKEAVREVRQQENMTNSGHNFKI
ncbi:hypothetical protein PVK06_034870 [Gossypium arboreum]|uniref:Uncharacterized protein n=1 Tax=Gossypium arboreum TaxID=29729 RepID=A0ABR0NGI0_GOSAR|nr:hypothetical protein PVK06_034870 [Gossypium arboreum]